MNRRSFGNPLRLFADYGMLLVLLLLCLVLSVLTYSEQHPTGAAAARQLIPEILGQFGSDVRVLIVAGSGGDDAAFADKLQEELTAAGATVVEAVRGEPRDARQALRRIADSSGRLDVIACTQQTASWLVFADLSADFPKLSGARVVTP